MKKKPDKTSKADKLRAFREKGLPSKKEKKTILKSLKELIKDADKKFSELVRRMYADENGWVQCFTCPKLLSWKSMHAGHFIGRDCDALRYDLRNVKVQCVDCNKYKNGNDKVFEEKLEKEKPGIVAILEAEKRKVYHPTREDIISVIADCIVKIDHLKK